MPESNIVPVPRLPDRETSQTIGLLRWVLMFLVVLIHTNLVADTGCEGTLYGQLYHYAGHVVWLANPLFFLISGYLFVASSEAFTMKLFLRKCRGRLRTWVVPYLLWNTVFLLFYGVVGLLLPSVLGEIPPLGEMSFADILRAYWCIRGEGFNSGPIDGPLWFLRDLMVIALFTPLFHRIVRIHKLSLLLPLLLASLPHQLGFESEAACFWIGCWLNVWMPSLSECLERPVWPPLLLYVAAVVALELPLPFGEWTGAPLLLLRNLSGMMLLARLAYRVADRTPALDWRRLAEPVFFVFALHFIFARVLTKFSARWLVAHAVGSAGFAAVHLLNALLSVGCCLLVFLLLRRFTPLSCRWLSGTAK